MSDNNGIQNEEEQPSNTPSKRKGKQVGLKSLKGWLTWARKEYRGITAIVVPCIAGIVAFWKGFGQWSFGFQPPLWIYFTLAGVLLFIWLVAFCRYYGEAHPEQKEKGKEKLRSLSLNVFVMIAVPVLVLSTLLAYVAIKWRLSDKIVILVEPFEEIGGVQDDHASGKDPEGIAETVKSCLEKAIRDRNMRLDVRVVLGKRHEKGSGEEMPLEELALKYRADMVISGWYVRREEESLVCPKFRVVRVPQPLPAIFRRSGGMYPKTIIFNSKEIENFDVNFTLGKLLTYEATMVLGAGAYASSDWKTAKQFFRTALQEIEKLESPEKGSETKVKPPEREAETKVKQPEKEYETKKNGASSIEHENLKGDEALLQLYMGHCLMNQSEFENAILRYDDAIEAGKKIPPSDMRYGEILTSAYLARGVAYRQTNAFGLAGQDFQTAGGYLPTSLGLRTMHTEEARFLSGDREKMKVGAKKYYNRGEKYLIQREYKHAQAYLEMSIEFYRTLMKGMPALIHEKYSIELARSLVMLGEIHNRLAKPELVHDEVTWQAIKYLDEGVRLTRRFGNQEDPNMLKIRADGLRHLGEAYRAMDDIKEVQKAFKYHQEAKKIWVNMKPKNSEGIANEWGRIGDAYRRLDDLEPYSKDCWLDKAIDAYQLSIKIVGGRKYLVSLEPNSLEEQSVEQKILVDESMNDITAHHLAGSLGKLAETHIGRYLAHSKKWSTDPNEQDIRAHSKKQLADPNEDIRISCKLLECAVVCYRKAVNELHKKKNQKWITRIKKEERNMSLKDDLAWCLTLYGYTLIKQGSVVDFNDPNCYYGHVTKVLEEAGKFFGELREVDNSHRVLSLFALTASQFELGKKQEARKTFQEACLLLRRLTREKKKVWYVDYVYDIMKSLPKRGFQFGTDDNCGNLKKLKTWLTAGTVRDGRRALDEIIESMDKKVKKPGEVDG